MNGVLKALPRRAKASRARFSGTALLRTMVPAAVALVASALASGPVEGAPAPSGTKAPCSPCHEQIQAPWLGSPHETAGRQVKGGFPCQECHVRGVLHPTAVTPANAAARCGRCHWAAAPGTPPKTAFKPSARLDEAAWQQGPHSGARVSCVACHSVHRYAEGADQRLLRLAGDALCRSCHRDLTHRNGLADPQALAKESCVGCHDPHGSETPVLESWSGGGKRDFQKAVVHRPVAEKKCGDCHTAHLVVSGAAVPDDDEEEAEDGEEPPPGSPFRGLLLRPGRTFCYLCHDRFREKFEASGHAKIHRFRRGEEQSPCQGCHLPHASEYPKLTRYQGNQLCLACHPGYAPHHFLARGGVKQSQLGCVKCHNPHGSGNRRLLVQNDVCKLCHRM